MTPGQLLRAARERHGASQASLAARAGTTQSAISRIENDRVSPSVVTLGRLLELLGESLATSSVPLDHGHDRAMLRANLALSPSERVRRGVSFANFALRTRGLAGDRTA